MSSKRYHVNDIKKKKKKNDDYDFFKKHNYEQEVDDYDKFFTEDHGDESDDAVVEQEIDAFSLVNQGSDELIWIKDSCDIHVSSTDTQAAFQLQANAQLILAALITAILGDVNGKVIAQEIMAKAKVTQLNKQKIIIVNSKDVTVRTTDSDVAANLQVIIQALIGVVITAVAGDINGG